MENKPKLLTENDLSRFKSHTRGVVALIVAACISTGIGIVALYFIVRWYIEERDKKYALLLKEYEASLAQQEQDLLEEGQEAVATFLHKNMVRAANYTMAGEPYLCKTCQQSYPNPGHEDITLCWSLRDVFPHDPHAKPPTNNPYQWYWFQVNGYPLPPTNWPPTRYWMPRSAAQPDPVAAMQAEGESYYTKHNNSVWDIGLGRQPLWYVNTRIGRCA